MKKSVHYVTITFLIMFACFVGAHIFVPESWLSTELCFNWVAIMLGQVLYVSAYYILMGDNKD